MPMYILDISYITYALHAYILLHNGRAMKTQEKNIQKQDTSEQQMIRWHDAFRSDQRTTGKS